MRDRTHPFPVRHSSVQEDWRAWLPEHKAHVFDNLGRQLETAYTMLSVSLNEALALRQTGHLGMSRQVAVVTAELSGLLACPLAAMLRTLGEHARHHGIVPNTVPLDPSNFRASRSLRTARMSALLYKIMLSQRSQFLHKVHILHEMVEDLEKDFAAKVAEIAEVTSEDSGEAWISLDELHYDLNTCLRESVVLLKSFLVVLPEEELGDFEREARRLPEPAEPRNAGSREIRHRRTASIAGK